VLTRQVAAAVSVGTYWPCETTATLRSARGRKALRRTQRQERGGGISWRPPAYSLLNTPTTSRSNAVNRRIVSSVGKQRNRETRVVVARGHRKWYRVAVTGAFSFPLLYGSYHCPSTHRSAPIQRSWPSQHFYLNRRACIQRQRQVSGTGQVSDAAVLKNTDSTRAYRQRKRPPRQLWQ